MKFLYDFHIHSALSPCADDDMTPINILATASAVGLEIVAISDHNAIANVKTAMDIGDMLDIVVVPSIELQTNEDIHLLCMFPTFGDLEKFYNSLPFLDIKNDPSIYGNQYVVNEDDEIVGIEDRLLLVACNISEYDVYSQVFDLGGIAIPAHIDRDTYSVMMTLGCVPDYYKVIEVFNNEKNGEYTSGFILNNSDSHTLENIGKNRGFLDIEEKTAKKVIEYLRNI